MPHGSHGCGNARSYTWEKSRHSIESSSSLLTEADPSLRETKGADGRSFGHGTTGIVWPEDSSEAVFSCLQQFSTCERPLIQRSSRIGASLSQRAWRKSYSPSLTDTCRRSSNS